MDKQPSIPRAEGAQQTPDDSVARAEHPASAGNNSNPFRWPGRFWRFVIDPKHSAAVMAIFTVVIGLTGIFYTVAAFWQLSTMVDSNEINRAALQSVQRAFVSFPIMQAPTVVFEYEDPSETIDHWRFSLPILNSGNTATQAMVFHVNAHPSKEPLPENFAYPDRGNLTSIPIVLAPHESILSLPLSVTPAELSGHMYVYGWAAYRDVFDKTPVHVSEFCWELTVSGDHFKRSKAGPQSRWSLCSRHNCTDEQCKDYREVARRIER